MEKSVTDRGFTIYNFTDCYGSSCSLQESSVADYEAVWLGIPFPMVRIMAADALKLNRLPLGHPVEGWVDYILPDAVSIHSRMHLNREQAAQLIPLLQKFVDTGELR